ncbi:hypothetical protein H4582DRAFT_1257078 [Lactarius indigo]|nr:hypothetical protein H4582DRAFT_1257078 [Lactarius indigo]
MFCSRPSLFVPVLSFLVLPYSTGNSIAVAKESSIPTFCDVTSSLASSGTCQELALFLDYAFTKSSRCQRTGPLAWLSSAAYLALEHNSHRDIMPIPSSIMTYTGDHPHMRVTPHIYKPPIKDRTVQLGAQHGNHMSTQVHAQARPNYGTASVLRIFRRTYHTCMGTGVRVLK